MPPQRLSRDASPGEWRGGADASQRGTTAARLAGIGFSVATALAASLVYSDMIAQDGFGPLDMFRAFLIAVSTLWLAWGAAQTLGGLLERPPAPRQRLGTRKGDTVILVPICGEDPVETYARIAAIEASLADAAPDRRFDIAVLSDTSDARRASAELYWHRRVAAARSRRGGFYYRRRTENVGRKAGNIADFIRFSGGAYEYAMILDSDSLMEGATIVEMVRRMNAAPDLGLLQSAPRMTGSRSRFGRAAQFANTMYGGASARGLATSQGRCGPFWGHNAIVRVRAFAAACGLPPLAGRPPLGGDILSHDYVEAAMLARAGWRVRLDTDLGGSFEEGPQTMIAHARRDRRWCQGNLQHARLLAVGGFRGWSRFQLAHGILTYVAPLFWLGFLVCGIAAAHLAGDASCAWGCIAASPVQAAGLGLGVLLLLFLPKMAVVGAALWRGPMHAFGGRRAVLRSALAEIGLSSIAAPVLLAWQARSVFEVLTGQDSGWPSRAASGNEALGFAQAWAKSRWIVLAGAVTLFAAAAATPELALWLTPVAGPMLASPFLTAWSSRVGSASLWVTPSEKTPEDVIARRDAILAGWRRREPMDARSLVGRSTPVGDPVVA